MTVEDTGKVTMYIDSKDNVSVSLELQGEEYGPFRGVFTCEEDLEIQRKDSGTWPIWGVWTDRNPYEPMPDFEKDFETVQGQVRKGETPKKVNYPEGRWLMFDKGSKDKPRRYSILEVSSEDVVYETGELWPYPGSVMFKPDYKVIASKDLTMNSGKFSPPEYDLAVTYNDASDTLVHPFLGTLVRVRNVKIVGIWSSISDQLMPDIEDVADIPEGTWYEFKKNTDKEDDTIWGISAAYTFSRIISDKDNSVEIDKGLAIMMPIQDNEFVQLTKIQCEKIAPDGTVTRVEKEDESVVVSEYGKGQIKFNMMQYYSVSSLNLKGKWSTVIPPVDPPDAEEGIYEVWDENGNAVYSAENAVWIEFNSSKQTFVWTEILEEPDGILIMTGNYRTFGKDLLVLTEIKGSFYARRGSGAQSFKDRDYMYGEMVFQVEQVVDKNKNPIELKIESVGTFKPL